MSLRAPVAHAYNIFTPPSRLTILASSVPSAGSTEACLR